MIDKSPVARSVRLDLWVLTWTATVDPALLGPHIPDHLRYVVELQGAGLVFASGPVSDGAGTVTGAGLTILRVSGEAEARALADADPLVLRGLRTYSLGRWLLVEGTFTVSLQLSDSSFTFGPGPVPDR